MARAYCDLYRNNTQEFPSECGETAYEDRIKAAYPIHPEVFERLYTDWSTLQNFQRTRGVLRLMASVIHSLWDNGDRSPLIMPANILLDGPAGPVGAQPLPSRQLAAGDRAGTLTGPTPCPRGSTQMCPTWAGTALAAGSPGPSSWVLRPFRRLPTRVWRTGASSWAASIPGSRRRFFGDAMRRLANTAAYLYQDGARYWYSTQPTVATLAEGRAEEYRRNRDPVDQADRGPAPDRPEQSRGFQSGPYPSGVRPGRPRRP